MKSEVSIIRGQLVEARVKKTIDLLGGMKNFVSPGDKVFIKPNLVYDQPPPWTTDLSTIRSIVLLARDAGAREIFVGDAPSSAERKGKGLNLRKVLQRLPLAQFIEDVGGKVCYLDEEEYVEVDNPQALIYKHPKIYKSFLMSDKKIVVPVLKTHFLTDVTLGIKCLYGAVALEDRKKFHRDDIHQKLVDLLYILRPSLTIIDVTTAMEGFGPKAGKPVRMDVSIASSDTVAADATACDLMAVDPMKVDHIRIAHKKGLGQASLDHLHIRGHSLSELRRNFEMPDLRLGGIYDWAEVIEGGVCRECRARSRWVLDELSHLKEFKEKRRRLTLITGVDPFLPAPGEQDLVVLIGTCALNKARNEKGFLDSQNVICAEGCPPDLAPRVMPKQVEDWLDEKS